MRGMSYDVYILVINNIIGFDVRFTLSEGPVQRARSMCSSGDAMVGPEQSEVQSEGAVAGRTAVRREVDVAIVGKSDPHLY